MFQKLLPVSNYFCFFNVTILSVCSYHVTYAFQSESTLYSCLNVKEFLARSRREIGSLSDCNWTRTHNHLVHKQTLNHLVFVYELSGCGFVSSYSHFNYFEFQFQVFHNFFKNAFFFTFVNNT